MTNPAFDDAFTMLRSILAQWGLGDLESTVRDMLTAGDNQDVIPLKLRETEPYKKRFAGNAARIKAGLPALSEAEYLATEASLKGVVRRYVGSGQYDDQSNVEKWIGSDLSPQELNDRMSLYQQNWVQQPAEAKDAWAAHGFTPQDAIKAIMDPSVDETVLKRKAAVYSIGAASVNAYHDDRALDPSRLGQLADAGVTGDQAKQGYQQIAARGDYEGFLARTQGVSLSTNDQENAALLGDQQAELKRRKVLAGAQAQFDQNYLAGNLAAHNSAGQY